LCDEYTRTLAPARVRAVETLALERTLSDLVNQAYGLTPAEINRMWKTAPPNVLSRCPREDRLARMQSEFTLKWPIALSVERFKPELCSSSEQRLQPWVPAQRRVRWTISAGALIWIGSQLPMPLDTIS